MANDEHLKILEQGVDAWNGWRDRNRDQQPDLMMADLTGAMLDGANLGFAQLTGATLAKASLRSALFWHCLAMNTNFSGANLEGADFSEAKLLGANFEKADLSGAILHWTIVCGANLSGANLAGATLGLANLMETRLDGAVLTAAKLWGTQREGWSIKGVICESAYWDREGKELTQYALGEFERAFAEKPLIVLKYPGGIQPVQLAMLPLLLEKLEREHKGSQLHIRSVQDSGSAATVTITVEDTQGRDPLVFQKALQVLKNELRGHRRALEEKASSLERNPRDLQKELKIVQSKMEGYRRALEEKASSNDSLRRELDQLKLQMFPLLLSSVARMALKSHQGRETLAVLFLDLTGYSKMDEEGQVGAVDTVRRIGRMVLESNGAEYTNTWGDAIRRWL